MAKNKITKIRKIEIKKFRGLSGVSFDLANRITLICGKNGTSKSTILGIIAQVFSFRKDYSKQPPLELSYKTLTQDNFESTFSDHFRFSKLDESGSMDINFEVYDGSTNTLQKELRLRVYDSADRHRVRPVVRGNKVEGIDNTSRNITHPLIYLSLARLQPIATRKDYNVITQEYLIDNEAFFKSLNNKILIKTDTSALTATSGSVKSLVGHSNKYDQDSVSVGEDNVGQIIQAILSFKKLKEEYSDYHGGILLIDECDAGLFPAAQLELINVLAKISSDLDLQIIITSHSPLMIEEIFNLSKINGNEKAYKNIYLTDTFGPIQVKSDLSWPQIYADLHVDTIKIENEYLPRVNVYFEDRQGFDFYNALINKRDIKAISNPLKDINISCSDLISLVKRKIPEFAEKSILILDSDVKNDKNYKEISHKKNVCLLPSNFPPDQLLFEFLYNLKKDDIYWKNKEGFTKAVFIRKASDIISKLGISSDQDEISLQAYIDAFRNKPEYQSGLIREMFKKFSKDEKIVSVVNGKVAVNPYRVWALRNPVIAETFIENYLSAIKSVLIKAYGLDAGKINSHFSK
ncbi:AAA family ATPase [Pantoea agglomerans]|uniref:AAA family ATPase n=1 Tax=Enterobacter agglomerans TaxID=549 RepID=UPI00077FF4B7|nr:AAA family ATPase [Pantoea agglomerans]KYN63147.1 AAA family ATPase [Pantoea agglomerans]